MTDAQGYCATRAGDNFYKECYFKVWAEYEKDEFCRGGYAGFAYGTLGHISFVGKPIDKILVMREQVLDYMKAQNCVEAQSNQTKFFKVKGTIDQKRPSQFIDIYDCKENVYVFINQNNLTISYFTGAKVKTRKWKPLGQALVAELQKTVPGLKLEWNAEMIKKVVVDGMKSK